MSAESLTKKKGSYFTPPPVSLKRRAARNGSGSESGGSGSSGSASSFEMKAASSSSEGGFGSGGHDIPKEIRVDQPGPVFKMPLKAVMVDQGKGYIPYIIDKSFLFLYKHLGTEGLFRLTGCMPVVEALVKAFDSGRDVNIRKYTKSPHDVCSLIKRFLRDLPEPIISDKLSSELINICTVNDKTKRLELLREVCDQIGEYERALLECLLYFLREVAAQSHRNKMNIANLATIFGPVLTRQPEASMTTAFRDAHSINSIMIDLIDNVSYLFGIKQLSGKFADHYNVLNELGSGGFATVYLVKEKKTNREFAAKVIDKKNLEDVDMKRLNDEITILKRIRHPGVVTLHSVFETDKEVILVMELAEGGELFDKIIEDGNYNESDAVRVLQQIITTVEHLHSMNIVHRDLKPENILLKTKNTREIKICDFGLSKVFDEATISNTICGTPGYVAPEILLENDYNKPVDMWSVGVIAYVLLSGYQPFAAENFAKLFELIKAAKYDFEGDEWAKSSAESKDFISKLLVLDPAKRLTATQALRHPFLTGRSTTQDAVKVAGLLQRERQLRRDQTLAIRAQTRENSPNPYQFNAKTSHQWKNARFKTMVKCDNCAKYMWPFYRRGFQCSGCRLHCHEKCCDDLNTHPCI